MHAREHVEAMVVNRLLRPAPQDAPDYVVEIEYRALRGSIDAVADMALRRTYVPGFTDDDLRSIFAIKAHQMLRQGLYDWSRPARPVFYVAFKNLVRDMLRCHERAVRRGLELDAWDRFAPGGGADERVGCDDLRIAGLT